MPSIAVEVRRIQMFDPSGLPESPSSLESSCYWALPPRYDGLAVSTLIGILWHPLLEGHVRSPSHGTYPWRQSYGRGSNMFQWDFLDWDGRMAPRESQRTQWESQGIWNPGTLATKPSDAKCLCSAPCSAEHLPVGSALNLPLRNVDLDQCGWGMIRRRNWRNCGILWRYCEGCRTCCRTWCLDFFSMLKWFEVIWRPPTKETQFILTLLIWIVENDGYDSSVSQEWRDGNYSTSGYNQCSISQYIIVFAPGTTGCILLQEFRAAHLSLHWASTVSMHMLAGLFLPRSHTRSCLNGDHHYLQRTAKLLLKIVSAHFRTNGAV